MSTADPYWRLKELFAAALEKPLAEREAFLRAAAGDDEKLIADVNGLLAMHDRASQIMPTAAGAALQATIAPPGAAEQVGDSIGPYKLLQLIGEGGFGAVYMAQQDSPVKRRVALKIIKIGMDTKQVIARFEQERQALAIMDHSGVAKVFDAGATSTGRPYFAMELVNGMPITAYCDQHELSIDDRLDLFLQVCQAVQHAHQKGLIHRDIKPSNVLVTVQDDRAIAKVIDFGVAKATQARLTEKTLFTEFRQLIGTPEYMSPEQAAASLDIDTRSDIYSLGVLLYELLTGATPFDSRALRSKAYGEIERIIREVDPPNPSMRLSTLESLPSVAASRSTEPRKLTASVRGELDWIVMKCLEKSRERRYQSATALAEDLLLHLSDQPIRAGKPSRLHRAVKFVRRNRGPVLATAAVIVVLMSGVIGTTIGLMRESKQRQIAEHQREDARDNLVDYLWMRGWDSQAEPILRAELAAASTANTQRKSNLYTSLGEVLCDLRRPSDERRLSEAEEMFLAAVGIQRARRPIDEAELSRSLINLGVFFTDFSRFEDAEAPMREAVAIARRTLPADDILRAEYLNHLASDLANMGKDLPEAESLTREAMAVYQQEQPPVPWRIAAAHCALAKMMVGSHRFPEAEAELIAAEPLQRSSMIRYRDVLNRLVDLYTTWDKADPGKGHDAKARQWATVHDALNPITAR